MAVRFVKQAPALLEQFLGFCANAQSLRWKRSLMSAFLNKKRKRIVLCCGNSGSVSTSTVKVSLIVLQWSYLITF